MKKRKRKPALSKEEREARRRSATPSTGSRVEPLQDIATWDPPLKDLVPWGEPIQPWK